MKVFCSLLLAVILSGCSLVSWHPFGTPASREKKAEQREDLARNKVLSEVQAAVHEAGEALDQAPDSRPVLVARDFLADAQALTDQAVGAPAATDVAKWRELVAGLISENQQQRAAADKERQVERDRRDALSDRLEREKDAHARDQAKLAEYAEKNEWLVSAWTSAKRVAIALVVFWLTAQLVGIAGKFYPPARAASAVLSGVMAPAHLILHSAVKRVEAAAANLTKT